MKVFTLLKILILLLLISCETRTYDDISEEIIIAEMITYTKDVKPIIQNNCTICHSPGGSSSFYPLTDYTLVKNGIENILNRVQRPAGDPQKMPQGGSLASFQIEILKKWKNNGLQE